MVSRQTNLWTIATDLSTNKSLHSAPLNPNRPRFVIQGAELGSQVDNMSSKKDEKALAAAERIKGMSRVQSEKAAASATRNVNAYGQKEEGPSRWQEKKELKRQMYLESTEKAVRLGERKGVKNSIDSSYGASAQCQKCFRTDHWTYECKNERVYVSRASKTKQIKNPRLKMKLSVSYEGNPDVLPEKEKDEKDSKKSKKKHHRHSDTESDSSLVTGSDNSSEKSSSSYTSSSESEEEIRRRKKKSQKKRKHRRYSSTSESSDSESESESDRKKSRRRDKKH